MSLVVGEKILKRYRIDEPIIGGGVGALYAARDETLDLKVLLKEYVRFGNDYTSRFQHEAQQLTSIIHPNLPRVHDYFVIDNRGHYLVMDFVEGQNLDELLRACARPFAEPEIIKWLLQVCAALNYLHTRHPPITHRQVNPRNIFITPEGKAVLTGFGCAETDVETVTAGFSAPEQYDGQAGACSDSYSLGATLYTLLTGQIPASSPTLARQPGMLNPPRALNRAILPAVEEIVLKAMSLEREQRFATVAELGAALGEVIPPKKPLLLAPQLALPAATTASQPAWPRQPALLWSVGALGVVLFALLIGQLVGRKSGNDNAIDGPSDTLTATANVAIEATAGMPVEEATVDQVAAGNLPPPPTIPATFIAPTSTPTAAEMVLAMAGRTRAVHLPSGLETVRVFVPAGSFLMGTRGGDEGHTDEFPQHEVRLDAFWLDQTEVTVAMFGAFINQLGNLEEGGSSWLGDTDQFTRVDGRFEPVAGMDNHPVGFVSWFGARAYCEWAGGRLPTEAEWEYAARGPYGWTYPWGNEAPTCELANVYTCNEDTVEVGSYPDGASWIGALDMTGNVHEWVNDWYHQGYYDFSPPYNPTGPEDGLVRAMRSSCVREELTNYERAAERGYASPSINYRDVYGIRCAES